VLVLSGVNGTAFLVLVKQLKTKCRLTKSGEHLRVRTESQWL